MDLSHEFTVPVPVDQVWEHFNDIATVAECFPGATVSSAEGDSFTGSVKVKLGPIALVYNGSGTFVDKDEAAHSFTVEAKGKDKRGNGTAGATVLLTMSEADSATTVNVVTDLAITGKPAQFGRGVMQDVSDKLLGQFVTCLEQRFSAVDSAEDEVAPDPGSSPTTGATPAAEQAAGVSAGAHAAASPPPRPAAPRPAPAPAQDDALDLGAAVIPVLAKAYWKQALAGLVVLAVVLRLRRR